MNGKLRFVNEVDLDVGLVGWSFVCSLSCVKSPRLVYAFFSSLSYSIGFDNFYVSPLVVVVFPTRYAPLFHTAVTHYMHS